MRYIKNIQDARSNATHIGGKAAHLFRLQQIGAPVPKFVVIPAGVLQSLLLGSRPQALEAAPHFTETFSIPQQFIDDIISEFPDTDYFAVRSSAPGEDSDEASFAGQYESYLFVSRDQLAEKIFQVWQSAFSRRVAQYQQLHHFVAKQGMAVIVQQMIDADVSGVGFGIHPVSGRRQAQMISAVYGLGEGLVSGVLDADHYTVCDEEITQEIVKKDFKIVFDPQKNSGTTKVPVTQSQQQKPALTAAQIGEISIWLKRCKKEFGKPQDIEFSIKNNLIYLLQSRPVTILNNTPDQTAEYVLWDNSNIIESYPGVTTPLTFSFIKSSYKSAYKLFCAFMGVEEKTICNHENVFANTLGLINGRVYYNLRNWYLMLAMLPGYRINARFMEKMMGVKERFDVPENMRISKSTAWWQLAKMAVNMYRRYLSLPRRRKEFMQLLETTVGEYKNIDYENKNANELMQLYRRFENKLLHQWKAPLLNDFFAMIWFGLLEKRTRTYLKSSNPNIHNDLLCGSADIISTQPIHRCIDMATAISANAIWKNLFIQQDENTIWQTIIQHPENFAGIKKEIDQYIKDFGERCVGELKLETVSYTQQPTEFVKILKDYVTVGITTASTSAQKESDIRRAAEKELEQTLRNSFFKKRKLQSTLRKARTLVSARENLRYERTRAFGIVRELFLQMGKNFYSENIITNARDIFYLTKDEIFDYIEGTSVTPHLNELIALRKKEFDQYKKIPPPPPRFATYGAVYHANNFKEKESTMPEGDLKGTGCCPGRVKAKVQVIFDPKNAPPLNGDILVTISTDPGWVTLFPTAAGILVERGSLLSHSAIVAREMGKPCVVGVSGLTTFLKTGDVVEMDGNTGVIKLMHPTHE